MKVVACLLAVFLLATSLPATAQWTEVPLDTTYAPYLDVEFITENVGFLVGMYGTALKTTDGGDTWTKMRVEECEQCITHYERVTAYENRVYIYGHKIAKYNERLIFKSTDGGETWVRVGATVWSAIDTFRAGANDYRVQVRYPVENMIAAFQPGVEHGEIAVSTTLGHTWNMTNTPICCGEFTGVFELLFEDMNSGVALKGGHLEPGLAVTTDGAKTWTQYYRYPYDISSLGQRTWLGNERAQDPYQSGYITVRTTDLGATWDTVANIGVRNVEYKGNVCYGQARSDPDTMVGRIVKSTDLGITWGWQPFVDSAFVLNGMSIPSTRAAYILIDSSRLFKTLNGGGPITELKLSVNDPPHDVTSIKASIEDGWLILSFASRPGADFGTIYDTAGRAVSQVQLTSEAVQKAEVTALPNGAYFFSIGNETVSFPISR